MINYAVFSHEAAPVPIRGGGDPQKVVCGQFHARGLNYYNAHLFRLLVKIKGGGETPYD